MCYMLNKLMVDLCKQAKNDLKEDKPPKKPNKAINLDYTEKVMNNLIEHRQNPVLTSRIKFKIQDLIDAYNKDWRFVITDYRNRSADNEGFK